MADYGSGEKKYGNIMGSNKKEAKKREIKEETFRKKCLSFLTCTRTVPKGTNDMKKKNETIRNVSTSLNETF